MRVRLAWIVALGILCAAARSDRIITLTAIDSQAQAHLLPAPDPSTGLVYVCPMDPDVRSHDPGSCRRCGMTLVAGVPDPVEFHLDLAVTPRSPVANELAAVQFFVRDPWKDRPVSQFNIVHEKLFHTFVVSQDLEFFEHGHPTLVAEGLFQYPITFPKAGMYRVLGDFYPAGATPQLTTETVVVGGTPPPPARLSRDYSSKRSSNAQVSLVVVPDQAVAGTRTQLRLSIDPGAGLEKYLGVWAHLLAVSDDLIDMIHEHPFLARRWPQDRIRNRFSPASTVSALGAVSERRHREHCSL
jgi:hypothetical protein